MEENQSSNLSRRELLKVLAASSGALAAAAFLPGKWVKPVVQGGVLPAHAQATPGLLVISQLDIRFDPDRTNIPALRYRADFAYDSVNAVTTAAQLYATLDHCGQIINGETIAALGGEVTTPYDGDAYFYFKPCGPALNSNSSLYLQMKVAGVTSNQITGILPPPV